MSKFDHKVLGKTDAKLKYEPLSRAVLIMFEGEDADDDLMLKMSLNAQVELKDRFPEFEKATSIWQSRKKDGTHLLAGGGGVTSADRLYELDGIVSDWLSQFESDEKNTYYLYEVETAINKTTKEPYKEGPASVIAVGLTGIRGLDDISRDDKDYMKYKVIYVFCE